MAQWWSIRSASTLQSAAQHLLRSPWTLQVAGTIPSSPLLPKAARIRPPSTLQIPNNSMALSQCLIVGQQAVSASSLSCSGSSTWMPNNNLKREEFFVSRPLLSSTSRLQLVWTMVLSQVSLWKGVTHCQIMWQALRWTGKRTMGKHLFTSVAWKLITQGNCSVAFDPSNDTFVQARATATGSAVPGAIFRFASQQSNGPQAIFDDPNGFLDITNHVYVSSTMHYHRVYVFMTRTK